MQKSHINSHIHPALTGPCGEIIADNGGQDLHVIHDGQRYSFDELPEHLFMYRSAIEADLQSRPLAIKALAEWKMEEGIDELRQYAICNNGGNDHLPDFDENGRLVANEFYDCGKRLGLCKWEGRVCRSVKVGNGYVTPTQLSVLALIDLPNKDIADRQFISLDTVASHIQNISHITGIPGKARLARVAEKMGISKL